MVAVVHTMADACAQTECFQSTHDARKTQERVKKNNEAFIVHQIPELEEQRQKIFGGQSEC